MPYTCLLYTSNILHHQGLKVDISRQDAKDAIMPRFYGSTDKPKEIFGTDTPEHEAFLQACATQAPGADELLQDLLQSWQPYTLKHSWVLPDNFHAHIKVMETITDDRIEVDELNHTRFVYHYKINQGKEKGLSNAANVVHSIDAYILRTMIRRCNYNLNQVRMLNVWITEELLARSIGEWSHDPIVLTDDLRIHVDLYNRTGMVDTVILDYLSSDLLIGLSDKHLKDLNKVLTQMLMHKPFPLVTVHDAFGAHVNNLNRVRYWYKEILAELAESTILDSIFTDIYGESMKYQKLSNDLSKYIRNSNYAIN